MDEHTFWEESLAGVLYRLVYCDGVVRVERRGPDDTWASFSDPVVKLAVFESYTQFKAREDKAAWDAILDYDSSFPEGPVVV